MLAMLSTASAEESAAAGAEFDETALTGFFSDHCVKCHGEQKLKGGVRLDQLSPRIADQALLTQWQDVLDVLNTGEMPPEDQQLPDGEELTRVIAAITENIVSARKRLAATGGVISMRHLTKREHLGSMRDLFGDDLPDDLLPDETAEGFDTNGAEQFFSLKQYERFYKAGKRVAGRSLETVAVPPPEPETVRHDPEIAPFETIRETYENMVRVKELIDAGAPIAEISKVNPKVADAGQVKLFLNRYEKRSARPRAAYEAMLTKEGISGSFTYPAAVAPRSRYAVTVTAHDAAAGEVAVRVNGRRAGFIEFQPGAGRSTELHFLTDMLDSEATIVVEAPFEHPETIDGESEVKLMFDMIALAFQTDQTRVSSCMMPSQSVLSSMGITIPVHALSHYNISEERRVNAGHRDKKCTELFGYLLDRLKETNDLHGGRLFDSCVVSYGTNIRSSHGLKGFPLFLSGGGIENLRLGESIMLPPETPLANVWLTLLQQAGVPIEQFSHSTGTASEILA